MDFCSDKVRIVKRLSDDLLDFDFIFSPKYCIIYNGRFIDNELYVYYILLSFIKEDFIKLPKRIALIDLFDKKIIHLELYGS